MIRLIGVLTEGGVPVKIKSPMDADGEMILGPLIEAAKALSKVMGSGEVRKLGFRENTLIVTESNKGYTIVALVNKAEEYMDSLLRVIADRIDDSNIPLANGTVDDLHSIIIDEIVDTYVRDHIEIGFLETLSTIWDPIVTMMKQSSNMSRIIGDVESLLGRVETSEYWNNYKSEVTGTLEDALGYALRGEFDRACAIAMDVEGPLAGVFSIKMGELIHNMTKAVPPTQTELKQIAANLPRDYPFTDLARTIVGLLTGDRSPADYARAFREGIKRFQFINDTEHLALGFLFLDAKVVDYPDFSARIVDLYKEESEVVCSFINAIDERSKLFEKLYSITSYDGFRNELGIYKSQISGILGNINWVLDPELLWELRKEGKGIEISVTASLKLQNYIAVLTALTESPVLTISERKEVLEEVLMLYQDYFRGLLMTDIALFSYTLDSIFQSLSVAHAEYYFLTTGENRQLHLNRVIEFVADIYKIIESEWPKSRVRFSLFVVGNALCPVFIRSDKMPEEMIRLVYIATRLQDVNTIDASQITRPEIYATNLGNTTTTLTAMVATILEKQERIEILKKCVEISLDVQEWFISHGIICRDDILSTTFHSTLILDDLDTQDVEKLGNKIIALNRIAIQNPTRYDYEVAMMGSPLVEIQISLWKKLQDDKYLKLAKETFDSAYNAWMKYGFKEKAENFKKKYGELWH
ncbi:hypothetical protein EU527_03010 [Candidatus Thorarchaeota archaeon]|nr:MAG: hypothetical protein EU527_03010 [Candidatus Thorarchaeota archaeon]